MRRPPAQHCGERLPLRTDIIQKLQHPRRLHLRLIPRDLDQLRCVLKPPRMQIIMGTVVNRPAVKPKTALPRRGELAARLAIEMPFTNINRCMTICLCQHPKRLRTFRKRQVIPGNTYFVRIHPGQQTRPVRSTHRACRVGMFKANPIRSECIQIGCLHLRIAIATEVAPAPLVGQYKKEVDGLLRSGHISVL